MKTPATGSEWVGLAQTDARKRAPPKTPTDHKPIAIKLFFWWLLHKITGGS